MPKINVTRSATINSPIDSVYSKLNDFNHWASWSPWLIMEDGVTVNIAEDAKSYSWKGSRVGEGNMSITLEDGSNNIEYDLSFLKPWKSEAKVKFMLSDNNERTTVTWSMDSKLPFFMFWMKKMMEGFIGMDYERGLNMLKDYIEVGEVKSNLEWKGESDFPGTQYIGIKTTCRIDKMDEAMPDDFAKIELFIRNNEALATGAAYSIYHNWDIVKRQATYTACVGVTSIPEDLPEDFVSGEIPATRVYTLRHTGKYDHLGNAWSTMMAMARGKEFKTKRGIHPWEQYITNPQETESDAHITDVVFAIK